MVRAKVALLRARQLAPGDAARRLRSPSIAATSTSPGDLRANAATGDRDHPRPLRLRQDDGCRSRCVEADRRRAHPYRRRAQAPARPATPRTAQRRRPRRRRCTPPESRGGSTGACSRWREASAAAGFAAIVDGAFLWRWQRELFRDLAREARHPVRRRHVRARARRRCARASRGDMQNGNDASDADLAVLEQQLRSHDPLDARTRSRSRSSVDTDEPAPASPTGTQWRSRPRTARAPARCARRRAAPTGISDLHRVAAPRRR